MMIRINLLPVRQARKRESGKQQILLGAVVIVLQVVLMLLLLYVPKASEVEALTAQKNSQQGQLRELEARSQELERLQEQRTSLRRQALILDALEANRAGPVQVMDELKTILNAPATELDRAAQAARGWDTSWDPTSLWIERLVETEQSVVIEGLARRRDDGAEFSTRLATSPFFSDVRLDGFREQSAQRGSGESRFRFTIRATVRYGARGDDQG